MTDLWLLGVFQALNTAKLVFRRDVIPRRKASPSTSARRICSSIRQLPAITSVYHVSTLQTDRRTDRRVALASPRSA